MTSSVPVYKKPAASSLMIRDRMRAQRTKDTEAERALRSALFRRGLRFRVNYKLAGLSRKTFDVVFPRAKVAVLVDGCFWHACPIHATWPKANADWWRNKIEENQRRDVATNDALVAAGWTVVRVWEHVDPETAAVRIVDLVRAPTRTLVTIT